MPRKKTVLSTKQLSEIINDAATAETVAALKLWAQTELDRRRAAGRAGGKPKKYTGDAAERNRQAARNYYQRNKESK